MKKVLGLLVFAFVVTACIPGPTEVPGAEPVFYSASRDEVYAAVVQAISTSPGLDNSNGWIITQSDSAGGFIRAQTTVTIWAPLLGVMTDNEAVSVVVSAASGERTQVVIQLTRGAQPLGERIRQHLDTQFGSR